MFFDSELEFSASTYGLLSLLAYFAASDSTRETSATLRDKSHELLSLLLWRALGKRCFFVHIDGVRRFDIREGVLHLQPLLADRPSLRRSPSFRNEHMPVVDLMVILARSQNKAAKVGTEFRAASSTLFCSIIRLVGKAVDFHLDFGAADSYFNLPVLRMASGKCRRISMSKKVRPAPPVTNSLEIRTGGNLGSRVKTSNVGPRSPDMSILHRVFLLSVYLSQHRFRVWPDSPVAITLRLAHTDFSRQGLVVFCSVHLPRACAGFWSLFGGQHV